MTLPDERWLSRTVPGAVSSLLVGLAALVALGGLLLLGVRGKDGYDVMNAALATGLTAVPAVGRALIRADARSRLGWLLLVSGCAVVVKLVFDQYARAVYTHGAALPHPAAAEFISGLGAPGQLALGAIVPLLLTGHLPSGRRWRLAFAAACVLVALPVIGNFAPTFWHFSQVANPWRVPRALDGLPDAANLIVVAGQNACYIAAALSIGAAARQLRQSRAEAGPAVAKQQRALVLLRRAAWLVTASYLVCLVLGGTGAVDAVYAGEHVALLIFAASAWVAVCRYELTDARQILDRTLRYGVLTALILGIYVGVLAVIGQIAAHRVPPLIAVAVAALAALPLRDTAQRGVARLVWGQASEPAEALARLSSQLTAAALPAQTLATAARTVGESLGVHQVLIEGPDHHLLASWARPGPDRAATSVSAPLTFAGQQVGWLRVTLRPGEVSLPRRSARLLTDVSPQIAAAIQALTSAAALEASRQRLLQLRTEERRRIRLDLHDGLGPALAGIGLGIERARETISRSPGQAMVTLAELGDHTRGVVSEVRRMVHDLQPSALAEHGLAEALRAEAERLGATMTVGPGYPGGVRGITEPVESAAYRIALEAMTNAVRHAGASEISLTLDVDPAGPVPALIIEVRDDGRGIGGDATPGLGLRSMQRRSQELGGRLSIQPGPAGQGPTGAVVRAELPLTPSCSGLSEPPDGDRPATPLAMAAG